MAFEDIEVRITKTGEVFVKIEGAGEERLRDYFSFLEESIGPVRSAGRIGRKDWDHPAGMTSESEDERQRRREQELGS